MKHAMKQLVRLTLAVFAAFLLLGGGPHRDASASDKLVPYTSNCEDADNFNWVKGDRHCFAIATVLPAKAVASPVLRVYVHTDSSRRDRERGRPTDYMYTYAARTPAGTVSVAMMRPNYFDAEGRQSSNKTYGRMWWETAEDVDEMAAAVRRLRKHHNASRVVMIGQGAGGSIAAVMLGRHPGTVDAALLVACPCDSAAWYRVRGWRSNPQDLNPMDYVDKIPASARIVAVTGALDKFTPASLCQPYVARLKERGVSARLELVAGVKTCFCEIASSKPYRRALAELSKE